jgi:hypothetical protein
MLKALVVSSLILLPMGIVHPVSAEESPAIISNIPIVERAFVDAVNGFDKAKIVAQFGEPAKADDVRIKGSSKVVASIWQYHNINKAEDGSFYPTTELDFIDDKVVSVVFLNNNGEELNEEGRQYEVPLGGPDMPM